VQIRSWCIAAGATPPRHAAGSVDPIILLEAPAELRLAGAAKLIHAGFAAGLQCNRQNQQNPVFFK
jgi:hypothetical protein